MVGILSFGAEAMERRPEQPAEEVKVAPPLASQAISMCIGV